MSFKLKSNIFKPVYGVKTDAKNKIKRKPIMSKLKKDFLYFLLLRETQFYKEHPIRITPFGTYDDYHGEELFRFHDFRFGYNVTQDGREHVNDFSVQRMAAFILNAGLIYREKRERGRYSYRLTEEGKKLITAVVGQKQYTIPEDNSDKDTRDFYMGTLHPLSDKLSTK